MIIIVALIIILWDWLFQLTVKVLRPLRNDENIGAMLGPNVYI